jgi:hypothetical protein
MCKDKKIRDQNGLLSWFTRTFREVVFSEGVAVRGF